MPAFADDSGICVAALGGEPGVHSARYAADASSGAARRREAQDERNNEKLIARLWTEQDRRAHYYCVIVLVRHAEDPEPLIAEGRWHGEVIDPPRAGPAGSATTRISTCRRWAAPQPSSSPMRRTP